MSGTPSIIVILTADYINTAVFCTSSIVVAFVILTAAYLI
jgi:hypothetical protein